jgi:hypothetical protein
MYRVRVQVSSKSCERRFKRGLKWDRQSGQGHGVWLFVAFGWAVTLALWVRVASASEGWFRTVGLGFVVLATAFQAAIAVLLAVNAPDRAADQIGEGS